MATLNFYLKDSKSEISSIYFRLYYGAYKIVNDKKKYLPLKYYISETINPQFWNSKTGRVKQDKRFRQHPEFNARLQYIEDKVLSLLRQMITDEELIDNNTLRERIDQILKPHKDQTSSKNHNLISFIDHYVETSGMRPNTTKSYTQTKRNLLEYEKDKATKLTFDKVDIDFHDDFIIYLKEKNYSINSIGDRIKVLKAIMRASYERGLHNNTDYQKRAFDRPKEETKSIYLNEKELEQLYNQNLSKDKKLNNVRDWFLIAAYTGLRFSDFSRLTEDNIKNDTISIVTQKTNTNVVIPLHTYVKVILEKHEYNLPKVISNQKFNKYIKEVCKLANLNDTIIVEQTKGDLKTKSKQSKSELVTAHTARRSFATNAFLAGVPTISIMKITGHKTEKVFMNYIKITEQENAKKLQLHPFFNKMIINK